MVRAEDAVLHRDSAARNRRQLLAVCGLLLLAVGLVFGQTARHEFVNLNDEYVYDNPPVSGGLSVQGITWAFTHAMPPTGTP